MKGVKGWLKGTFSDFEGVPSFKRQGAAVLLIACIVLVAVGKDITALATLSGSFIVSSAFEKFNKFNK